MRTKILCGIGPSSSDRKTIKWMIEAGMSIARFNFSHGDPEQYRTWTKLIREEAEKLGKKVPIMQDLQGPRIRLGQLTEEKQILKDGDKVTIVLHQGKQAKTSEIPFGEMPFPFDLHEGSIVMLNEGKVTLEVTNGRPGDERFPAAVRVGGWIASRKGINVPTSALKISALTAKDKEDLMFGQTQNYELVGLSFVQNAQDVIDLRAIVGKKVRIYAKIESRQAIENFDEIMKVSDGIIIARGDLGVELPIEDIPIIQKELILRSRYNHVPTITATQMLSNMIQNPLPTRAEVSDIANAVFDRTDCLWLSDETAVGQYPVLCVQTMAKIIERTERFLYQNPTLF